MKILKIGIILLAAAFFIAACAETSSKKPTSEKLDKKDTKAKPTATLDEVASGRNIYKEQCVKCHKDDGTGGKVEIEGKTLDAEDFTTEKMVKHPDEEYIEHITDGVEDEGMPSFKDILSTEEMKEVIRFIRKEFQK